MNKTNPDATEVPVHALDARIHAPVRLGIMLLLQRRGTLEFPALRQVLEVSDGNLSTHLSKLEQAGFVAVTKHFVARRPSSTYTLTAEGSDALTQYLTVLRELLGDAQSPSDQ